MFDCASAIETLDWSCVYTKWHRMAPFSMGSSQNLSSIYHGAHWHFSPSCLRTSRFRSTRRPHYTQQNLYPGQSSTSPVVCFRLPACDSFRNVTSIFHLEYFIIVYLVPFHIKRSIVCKISSFNIKKRRFKGYIARQPIKCYALSGKPFLFIF